MDQMYEKRANIFHCKTLPKFTQIWIFGSKTYHLATLSGTFELSTPLTLKDWQL
jgi:hypothetical protein